MLLLLQQLQLLQTPTIVYLSCKQNPATRYPWRTRQLEKRLLLQLQQALKNLGPKHQKAKVLKEFQSLIEDLGGKPSKPEK